MNASPNFRCYGSRPSSSPVECAIRFVLCDARGFFRSSGMTVGEIRSRIAWKFGVRVPSRLVSSLLRSMDRVLPLEGGRWKVRS